MFISTGYLGIQYGVDNNIAKFFVDREPPANNLYWKDKYLYLRPSPGYLFIPLIVDIPEILLQQHIGHIIRHC